MRAFVVVDLGFGDAGKGSITDFLSGYHQAELVVLFNGGAQRAHNVVAPHGQHHTFSQFGSGTFYPRCRTLHGPDTLVNPLNMLTEGGILYRKGIERPFERVFIDERASIITPFHVAANRLRERARGIARHGSCGEGIGETASDRERELGITARDLVTLDRSTLAYRLELIRRRKLEECTADVSGAPPEWEEWKVLKDETEAKRCTNVYKDFAKIINIVPEYDLAQHETVIFEGSQGVLLDQWYGFHPYTTWSDCTFNNANRMLEGYDADVTRVGVTRAYGVRHGAGPFPTESLTVDVPEPHNTTGPWQGPVRRGYTDLLLLRYAIDVLGGIDQLAVTCLDQLPANDWRACSEYLYNERITIGGLAHNPSHDLASQESFTRTLMNCEPVYWSVEPSELVDLLEKTAEAVATLQSYGPTRDDKEYQRTATT